MMTRSYNIIAAAGVAVFVLLLVPLHGGFTDDGYIHIQYARNIVENGEYSFNPGYVSFGTTSPLWVMWLAAVGWLVDPGEFLIHTSRVLAYLTGCLSIVLMAWLCKCLEFRVWTTAASVLFLACHTWMLRWTALAMETPAAVAAILAVAISAHGAGSKPGRALWLGLSMAAAALLRPEAYLLPVVLVVAYVWNRRSIEWRSLAVTLAVYCALIVPWLLFARLHLGHFLPNTAGAKSGGVMFYPIVPIARVVGSAEALPVLLAVAGVVLMRGRCRLFQRDYRVMLLWAIALPLAYVLMDVQVLSRYMLLVTPFVIVLGFGAAEDLFRGTIGCRVATAAIVAAVALNLVLYFKIVVPPSRAFSEDLTIVLKQLALTVRDDSEEGAVVAAADIGYLGFYSGRFVLDLGGLVDDNTTELRERYDYEEIVERGLYLRLEPYPRVDYFIDRVLVRDRFTDRTLNGYRFEKVREVVVRNLGIKKPGPYYYTLYRLQPDA